MANNAESKSKATHEVAVIRRDGSREVASIRELHGQEKQALWELVKDKVEEGKDGK